MAAIDFVNVRKHDIGCESEAANDAVSDCSSVKPGNSSLTQRYS